MAHDPLTAAPSAEVNSSGGRPRDAGPRTFSNGYLFGAPVRDLGWFSSLIMGLATGMAGFFAATFVGIMAILIWNTASHHAVDFAWSYTRFGFWVGLAVMIAALSYLGTQWVRRQMRRNR